MSVPWLALCAFGLGACEVLFDVTAQAALPALVPPNRLHLANSRLMVGEAATLQIGGPALGGLIFGYSHSGVFAVICAVFLTSGLLFLAVRRVASSSSMELKPKPATEPERGNWRSELREGLRWFGRAPAVRSISLLSVALNLSAGGYFAILVLFARDELGIGSTGYGLLLAVGSFGILAAASAGELLSTAGRRRAACLLTAPVVAVCFIATAAFPVLPVAVVALVVWGAAATTFSIVAVSLRQSVVPDRLLGRVTSIHRFLCWGALPLGALAAGLIADYAGLRAVLLAGGLVIAAGLAVAGPSLARVPTQEFAPVG
jgi:MFS family permease